MSESHLPQSLVGGDILNLITAGMHSEPLCIYREYIQNSADSISASGNSKRGRIEISIDLSAMRLIIRDNGPGLSYKQAIQALLPIASSHKRLGVDRGFRGIGRLSGLAFSESVTFLTRSTAKEKVTRVNWDGANLRKGVADGLSPEKVVSKCVTVSSISGVGYPSQFFQVEVNNVSRFAAASILNCEAVRNYIGEVCPVPFASDFPYAQHIKNLFPSPQPFFTLDIFLNDEKFPITRRQSGAIYFSESRKDNLVSLEEITVPAINRDKPAAVGWVAHSSYIGAIPKALGIRCVRARVGNIQIGDETLFDHLFKEDRFNRWCMAELHILDPNIVPNGRRDYFEPGPHTRNLENHLSAVFHNLEERCRSASKNRNRARKFELFLDDIDATYKLAKSNYLIADAARELIDERLNDVRRLLENGNASELQEDRIKKLNSLEKKLAGFRVRSGRVSFEGVPPSDVNVYRKVFYILAKASGSPRAAMKTIESILEQASADSD